ncbi:hypothetical protein GGX14DRAFT_583168 [Mycena pura]|uniref:Arrestin-like N-terminal domain-containing protein n=1 Tax=Mycena pura TaxID=153505 RepID=A0AAD6YVM8_9AGAR|nr:hypothetical protein GGX14DRAFT_583168 [Mycena pura]
MTDSEEHPPSYFSRDSFVSELPGYDSETATTSSLAPAATNAHLTAHGASRALDSKRFSYDLKKYWSKPWATLTLLADPRLSRDLPVFVEGGDIAGTIKLNFPSKETITGVSIVVKGDLVTFKDPPKHLTFFRMQRWIWSPSMGDPRAPVASGDKWEDKLQGEYNWPFSIKIPQFTTDSSTADSEQFRLPHSYTERLSKGGIDYYVGLHIHRAKLRVDDSLISRFGYFTMQQPGRPSVARQLAYQNNTAIPGPYSDPDGWHALEPVQIRGTVFGNRAVDAKCMVFLAKPLRYTRGTAIPCAMTFETADTQAADLLASIKSSRVFLQRCIKFGIDGPSSHFSACGQATWWPSPDDSGAHQRHMMGEIHLSRDLHPSSAISLFGVEYAVALFPPEAAAFTPESFAPLITQAVEVVTCFAPGARQRLASPPAYDCQGSLADRYYRTLPEMQSYILHNMGF